MFYRHAREDYVDWPRCVQSRPDFATLFGGTEGVFSPRMAAMVYVKACFGGDIDFRTSSGDLRYLEYKPPLPRIARPFWKSSLRWRRNFVECYRRIACRLHKGLPPSPNCTGEEMALHNIMGSIEVSEIDESPRGRGVIFEESRFR